MELTLYRINNYKRKKMRINSFIIALFITVICNAQSVTLKEAYQQVYSTLKNYKFQSQDVYESNNHGRTKSILLELEDGYFVFFFNDDLSHFGYRNGQKRVSFPIASAMIGIDGTYNKKHIYVRDSLKLHDGVELLYQNKTTTLPYYEIYGDELTLKKLLEELQELKNVAKMEMFLGILKNNDVVPSQRVPKSKIMSKKEKATTSHQKQRQRKRIPFGK